MLRTVKAWGKITKRGALCLAWDDVMYLVTPTQASADNRVADGEGCDGDPLATIVPVTITYDDGRPAPRKRTKGKKGGR